VQTTPKRISEVQRISENIPHQFILCALQLEVQQGTRTIPKGKNKEEM